MENTFLKIGHVRSLSPSIDVVKYLLGKYSFDVLGITESWLTDQVDITTFTVRNYTMFKLDRFKRGGGILVYIRSSIEAVMDYELSIIEPELEQLWLNIKFYSKKYLVGVVYRPPNESIRNGLFKLETAITSILSGTDETFLIGDLNIDLLKSDINATLHTDLLNSCNLQQIFHKPTRIMEKCQSLIDILGVSQMNL